MFQWGAWTQSGAEEITLTSAGSTNDATDKAELPPVDCNPRGGGEEQFVDVVTKDDIWRILDQPFSACEERYANDAVAVSLESGALHCLDYEIVYWKPPFRATQHHLDQFAIWQEELKGTEHSEENEAPANIELERENNNVARPTMYEHNEVAFLWSAPLETIEGNASGTILNECQCMAYNIVLSHLRTHLCGGNPPQWLMIVYGPGGTGKTAMLNAISNAFANLGATHLLAKTAYSSIAASLIGGQMLHSWGALPIKVTPSTKWITHPGKEVNGHCKRNFAVLWLFIDEMSMLTTPLLDHLSQATGIVRSGIYSTDPSIVFGSLNVMLLGNFHHLPPVANSKRELYHSPPEDDSSKLGRNFYKQFGIVVKLEQQMRIINVKWDHILKCTRTGDCMESNIEELRKLVLTNENCHLPDFTAPPWDDTMLVTPCNSAHVYWNERKVEQHCCTSGEMHYMLYAHDSTKQDELTLQQRLVVASLKLDDTNHLPNKVDLAIGMKVMVLLNIDTDSDLANGSCGMITDIIFDPREPEHNVLLTKIVLSYPPVAILFKLMFGGKKKLSGLP